MSDIKSHPMDTCKMYVAARITYEDYDDNEPTCMKLVDMREDSYSIRSQDGPKAPVRGIDKVTWDAMKALYDESNTEGPDSCFDNRFTPRHSLMTALFCVRRMACFVLPLTDVKLTMKHHKVVFTGAAKSEVELYDLYKTKPIGDDGWCVFKIKRFGIFIHKSKLPKSMIAK